MAIESLMAAPGEALPMDTPSINASQISARIWPKPAAALLPLACLLMVRAMKPYREELERLEAQKDQHA